MNTAEALNLGELGLDYAIDITSGPNNTKLTPDYGKFLVE